MKSLVEFFESLSGEGEIAGDVSQFDDPTLAFATKILTQYEKDTGIHLSPEGFEDKDKHRFGDDGFHDDFVAPFSMSCSDPLIRKLLPDVQVLLEYEHNLQETRVEIKLMIWGNHVLKDMAVYELVGEEFQLIEKDGEPCRRR